MQLLYAPLDAYRQADSLPQSERLAAYAALNRFNALYMIQRAGSGHIGSTFSSMDIISYMLLEHPEIAFFSSKGHDAPAFYANLIALGRLPFDSLHLLRRVGGLPGHPELRTPGMIAHSGSLGMGVSKAKGLIRANRLRGIEQQMAVLLGDGELQEGQIWEALMQADYEELTIIVDRNCLATDSVPFLPELEAKLAGFGHVENISGHNFADWAGIFAWNARRPVIVIAHTIKGKGVSFIEHQPQYHSGALSSNEYEAAVTELQANILEYLPAFWPLASCVKAPKVRDNALRDAYEHALNREGQNQCVIVLDADLAQDCGLRLFRTNYPARFIECGIAEQDMVSQAGMLAAQGFVPICHSFAAFLTRRANEQIYDNCHQRLKVIYVGALAGRLPDGPGPSHEALQDVALMRTMPGMEILEPRTAEDVGTALHYAVNQAEEPVYIRLAANPIEGMRHGWFLNTGNSRYY